MIDTIKRIKRVSNSHAGNPRFEITLANGGTLRTAANHGFAYSITPNWEGESVRVQVGGRGTIINMERI